MSRSVAGPRAAGTQDGGADGGGREREHARARKSTRSDNEGEEERGRGGQEEEAMRSDEGGGRVVTSERPRRGQNAVALRGCGVLDALPKLGR